MSRFAEEGYRVLYVQPSHSIFRKYRKPELADNRLIRPRLERIDHRITLFSPPKLLPKPLEPISRKISCAYSSLLIAKAMRRMDFVGSILWVYDPVYAISLKMIPHSKLVFDLADDLSSYGSKQSRGSRFVAHCTTKLATESDLMIVTSPTLYDMYRHITNSCVEIPNGFDEKLFNEYHKTIPADLRRVSGPIAGFVGTLFSFLDFSLLYSTAKLLPDVSFVFIGPVEDNAKEEVQLLDTLDNTHFLGPKSKEMIPAYLASFDVCLNPFKVDRVSKSVSPLKIYEYLAMGKPVLSTPMLGIERESVGRMIDFAGKEVFATKLEDMIKTCKYTKKDDQQMKAIQKYSWTSRYETLVSHIKAIK
jgi:glycosyltransferase involved in cell wall biosynthesis